MGQLTENGGFMVQQNQVFYSFPIESLVGFEDIDRCSKQLVQPLGDAVMANFQQRTDSAQYKTERQEIYNAPEPSMVQREVDSHLLGIKRSMHRDAGSVSDARSGQCVNIKKTMVDYSVVGELARIAPLNAAINRFFDADCICVGDFVYPPMSYRSWHTNQFDALGWAMFIVRANEPHQSFFKYVHPQTRELVTVWETRDTVNFFPISNKDLLWHCIGVENTTRWSHGFIVPDNWRERIHIRDAASAIEQ